MKASLDIELRRANGRAIGKKHHDRIMRVAFQHALGLVKEGFREGELVIGSTTRRPYPVNGWWKLRQD